MLGRHVPRGGARVLDLNVDGGKNLFYYPKDTVQVLAVNPRTGAQLLENQAASAGIPVETINRSPEALGLPRNSLDAAVSVHFLQSLPREKLPAVLKEIHHVLKPGKPFIFLESSGGSKHAKLEDLIKASERAITNNSRAAGHFERVEVDHILEFPDPHLVGVAFKPSSSSEVSAPKEVAASSSPSAAQQGRRGAKPRRR
eukprot:SM000007S20778  [mRNA]  locus=s7:165211:166723:- [translate_table: standard]